MADKNDFDQTPLDAAIRDRALAWYQKMEPEILALAGRESTAAEQAIAQMIILGEIGAKMYGALRKDFDVQTAQSTLQTAFMFTGGVMRRNGESVHMRVSAEFTDVAAPQGLKPLAQVSDKPCTCTLDLDGRCLPCIEILRGFCSKRGQSMQIMQEIKLTSPTSCVACFRRHMDFAMSEFVRRDLGSMDPETSEAIMKMFLLSSQALKAQSMPLMMKAWDEIQKKGV